MIVPKRQAGCNAFAEPTKALTNTLPDRLQRLEPGGAPGRMEAERPSFRRVQAYFWRALSVHIPSPS